MPITIGNTVTAKTAQLLTGPSGVNLNLEALALSGEAAVTPLGTAQVRTENVALELVERATAVRYPAVNVYCEKIVNQLVEKFRTFWGSPRWRLKCDIRRIGWTGCKIRLSYT